VGHTLVVLPQGLVVLVAVVVGHQVEMEHLELLTQVVVVVEEAVTMAQVDLVVLA
jgi:hypothetical protein